LLKKRRRGKIEGENKQYAHYNQKVKMKKKHRDTDRNLEKKLVAS
jgi:hypothetical protein